MCGRFVSASSAEDIARYFEVDEVSEQALEHTPNHNVAPTTDVFVVFSDGSTRRLDTFHWGLVPRWAKDLKVGNRMINARSETAAEKPAFRSAIRRRRCLVPADGFYEWHRPAGGGAKQPYFIHRRDHEPLAFGGLWEEWRGEATEGSGEVTVRSTTILTGAANATMAPLHDRMPIMVPASGWAEWLDPGNTELGSVAGFLDPAPEDLLTFHPVSTEVNNARNKGDRLTERVDVDGGLGSAG